ncbi:MAG TPA: hypothetical protein VG294_07955 [Solirubrobacteraceae bacterium]|jgi:hypothetical protein|nr:hypothetical protein [Solirubrobacteraceae bacterium]
MRCRIAAWAACSVLVACAISACGGGASSSGNGVAAKSPNEIVSSALNAIDSAKSAHISGKVISGSSPITLNLHLVSGQGGKGAMSEGGLSFQIEVIGQEVYINGSPDFWKHFGGAAAAQVFQGKWLKAPASGQFASLAQLSNLHALLSTVLSTHGALTKTGTSTINGQNAVGVRDSAQGGTLYVATTGKPYPLEIVKKGGQGGRIVLNEFDQPVSLTPPPNAIDISKFK